MVIQRETINQNARSMTSDSKPARIQRKRRSGAIKLEICSSEKNVQESTVRRSGGDYDSAEEFDRANSAIHTIGQIRKPTLLVRAEDDPVVDREVFNEIDWNGNASLYSAMVLSGGHTEFRDRDGNRWHEDAAIALLKKHGQTIEPPLKIDTTI